MIYDEGDTIYSQNDKATSFLCIESGQLLLVKYDNEGQETAFRIVGSGETIGWRSFFSGEPHAASLVALTPVRACWIPGPQFKELLRENFDLTLAFLKTVACDRGPREGLLLRNPLLPVRARLINLLIILARQIAGELNGEEVCYVLPISRQQISALVGIRIETVSRMLATLAEDGVCFVRGRNVAIPNLQNLIDEVEFELPS